MIQPAYFDNQNLAAQKGLLSFWRDRIPEYTRSIVHGNNHTHNAVVCADGLECDFSEIPLNKKYAEFVNRQKLDGTFLDLAHSIFYKITFSYSCLEKALLHLSISNIHSGILFPGFSGVVKHMRDNAMTRKQAMNIFTLTDWTD